MIPAGTTTGAAGLRSAPRALLVSSTRVHADAREALRIHDTASVLADAGWSVDLLVPRKSALLEAALPSGVRMICAPRVLFSEMPPRRPSLRRFAACALTVLRGIALVSRNGYALVHGFNDGAIAARAIDRATLQRFPYVADYTEPFGTKGLYRGAVAWLARSLEHSAMRHAAAIVFSDAVLCCGLAKKPPQARVSIIPDPHAEIVPDSFTKAEFSEAVRKVHGYAMDKCGTDPAAEAGIGRMG